VTLLYNFSGFLPPVDNLPALNMAKAGRSIPIKFSLGGNQGLNIFAAGYPKSHRVVCGSVVSLGDIKETVPPGAGNITYDSITRQYIYVWKSDGIWADECRQLVVRLSDGTDHFANFKFK